MWQKRLMKDHLKHKIEAYELGVLSVLQVKLKGLKFSEVEKRDTEEYLIKLSMQSPEDSHTL